MKTSFYFISVFIMLCLLTEGCISTSKTSLTYNAGIFSNYSERYSNTESLLDLDYGRERDSDGNYICDVLDTIKGLLHKEYASVWRNSEDSTCFNMSIGVYIDTVFPSVVVEKIMLEKVDSIMAEGLSFDLPEREPISLKSQMYQIPDSIPQFLKLWESNFDRLTKLYNNEVSDIRYDTILDSRGCAVCHKIYEDPKWVTYILESSVNYHGSLGCNSSADYITIDKHSGKILFQEDILSEPSVKKILNRLPSVYSEAASKKDFTPKPIWDNDGESLFRLSDGVALINEGLLVYYVPYNIGCGAEGQYNLIIPFQQ